MIGTPDMQEVGRLKQLYPTLTEYKGNDYASFIENVKSHSELGCVVAQSQEFKIIISSMFKKGNIVIYRLTGESKKKFKVQGNWLMIYGNNKQDFTDVGEVEAKYNEVVAQIEKSGKESKEAWLKCAEYIQDWAESLGLASKKIKTTEQDISVSIKAVKGIKYIVSLKNGNEPVCCTSIVSDTQIPWLDKYFRKQKVGLQGDKYAYYTSSMGLSYFPDRVEESLKELLKNQAREIEPVIDILHLTEMKERLKDTANYVPCQKKIYNIKMTKLPVGTIFFNKLEQASDIQKFGLNPDKPVIKVEEKNYRMMFDYCRAHNAGYICDGIQITLIGTAGEMWNTKPANVAKTYTLANGTELTEDVLNSMPLGKVFDIKVKPNTEILYAIQVPKAIRGITVDVGWAVLAVNDLYAEHGNGDYILLSTDSEGKPDINKQRVINGLVFAQTYGKPELVK